MFLDFGHSRNFSRRQSSSRPNDSYVVIALQFVIPFTNVGDSNTFCMGSSATLWVNLEGCNPNSVLFDDGLLFLAEHFVCMILDKMPFDVTSLTMTCLSLILLSPAYSYCYLFLGIVS